MKREWIRRNFKIESIALSREQIERYNPPPNPAKRTDPRAKEFILKNGGTSWEVDALKPEVLNAILEKSIIANIDLQQFYAMVEKEKEEKLKIAKLRDFI